MSASGGASSGTDQQHRHDLRYAFERDRVWRGSGRDREGRDAQIGEQDILPRGAKVKVHDEHGKQHDYRSHNDIDDQTFSDGKAGQKQQASNSEPGNHPAPQQCFRKGLRGKARNYFS